MWRLILLVAALPLACGSSDDRSPLDRAANPGITLPVADMARLPDPELLEHGLVIRMPETGYLPAVRLSDGVTFAITDEADLKKVIRDEAERAGNFGEPTYHG